MAAALSFDDCFEIEERDGRCFAQLDGFGGYTLGCTTLALARAASGDAGPQEAPGLHALHACFVRPLPTERPVELSIERLSEGRRFSRKRLEIREDGKLLFLQLASFAAPAEGPEFSEQAPQGLPEPESLPTERDVAEAEGWDSDDDDGYDSPIEMRWCGRPWALDAPAEKSVYHAWVKPAAPPRSDAGRVAGIAFTADYHSHWPVARKRGGPFDTEGFVSLDQIVWIHRDDAWDDWWLLTSWTEQAHAGRSLGHRTLHTRDGRLVASMAQESMIPGARLR